MGTRRSGRRTDDDEPNKNTEWFGKKGFWMFYFSLMILLLMLFGWMGVALIGSDIYSWLLLHITHSVITFVVLHWLKGSPFWLPEDQGRFDDQTFWEQIDNGRQYTFNRKVMTVIPILLSLRAAYTCGWDTTLSIVNLAFLLLVLIPKSEWMHHVPTTTHDQD